MNATRTSSVITATFLFERETAGAVRYQEVDDKDQPLEMIAAKIGTLYIRKTAFEAGSEVPKRLMVTVEAGSDNGQGPFSLPPTSQVLERGQFSSPAAT